MSRSFDLAVLGGGPGGYAAAIRGSQLGLKVALVDPRPPGGVCLHEGCIPSKALLHGARVAHEARHQGPAMGIHVGEVRIDVAALQSWKQGVVSRLSDGVKALLTKHGVEIFPVKGRLAHASALDLLDPAGHPTDRLLFKSLILATGSKEKSLKHLAAAGDLLWTPRDALSFKEIPKRLAIVGAGIIGLELGQLFARLGAEVHLIEALPELLPGRDRAQVAQLKKSLEAEGLVFHMGSKATGVSGMTLRTLQGDKERSLPFERLLVSVGREPQTQDLGLERLNIDVDNRGLVRINGWLQTTLPHIFAIGDITEGPQLAHRATRMGTMAAENATGARYPWDVRGMPGVLYTDPPMAWVGVGVEEAKHKGLTVKTGLFPLSANGRAQAEGQVTGSVQVIAGQSDGRLLGVEALGEGAEGMVAAAAHALEMGADAADLGHVVAPHPSVFEALGEAAHAVDKLALHIFQKPSGKTP